jgi:hypothetical protein
MFTSRPLPARHKARLLSKRTDISANVGASCASDEATARLIIGTFRAGGRDPKLFHAEAMR